MSYLIRDNVEKFLKTFPGVSNYHVEFKMPSNSGTWNNARSTMMIRLWIKEDIFNANDIALQLSEGEGFYRKIEKLVAGNYVIRYDTYKN